MTVNAMTLSVAEKANAFSTGDNRTCSDGGSGKNQCNDGKGQGQGTDTPRRDFYAMEVDRGRNCYACGRFGHMACHCRNQERGRVADGRRLEYGGERKGPYKHLNHLKEEENLEFLD